MCKRCACRAVAGAGKGAEQRETALQEFAALGMLALPKTAEPLVAQRLPRRELPRPFRSE